MERKLDFIFLLFLKSKSRGEPNLLFKTNKKNRKCVCVCVCVRERERECVSVREGGERERVHNVGERRKEREESGEK